MEVFFSELAETRLTDLCDYLEVNWSLQAKEKFVKKLKSKVSQISLFPDSCPTSIQLKGLYKCVVTKQTTLFYRVLRDQEEIEIIAIFDTRQNPNQLKKLQ